MRHLPFQRLCGVVSTALFSLAVIAFFPCAGQSAPHPRFHITDLGVAPAESRVQALNNRGDVVGLIVNSNGVYRPALFRNGTVTALPLPAGAGGGFRLDINNAGDIIGHFWIGQRHYPFLLRSNILIDLNAQTGLQMELAGINNAGVIAANISHGFRLEAITWSNGVVRPLGQFGPTNGSFALGINNRGEVLIQYYSEAPPGPGTISALVSHDTSSILGVFSAWTLNDRGHAAGELNRIAFRYTPRGSRLLGTLPGDLSSYAWRMNNAGRIIGESEDTNDRLRSFLSIGRRMYDVSDLAPRRSGWTMLRASDINDRGQIVGTGELHGERHAFLLTPVGKQPFKPARPIPVPKY